MVYTHPFNPPHVRRRLLPTFANTPNLSTIYGWYGSTAEAYARQRGIEFIPLDYFKIPTFKWNYNTFVHEINWGHEMWGYSYSIGYLPGMQYQAERIEVLEGMFWGYKLWNYYNSIGDWAGMNYHFNRFSELRAILR